MADNTTELEVLNQIVDVLGGQSGQYETVVPTLQQILALLGGGGGSGYNPSLSVGRADALTGADETAQWATRESTGSGSAIVRSVQGATVVWNQSVNASTVSRTGYGIVLVPSQDTSWAVSGTVSDSPAMPYIDVDTWSAEKRADAFTPNHKYLIKVYDTVCTPTERFAYLVITGNGIGYAEISASNQRILTPTDVPSGVYIRARIDGYKGTTVSGTVAWNIFDLTAMFGSGNEPATVEEFEAMYPEPYYPYSAPTLKPVQIAGIQSVGFNQWDEEWEQGYLNVTSGAPSPATNSIRSKNYCRIIPDQTYYLTCSRDDGGSQNRFYAAIFFYDEEKAFISYAYRNRQTFTVPSNAAYFKLCTNTSTVVYGGTYTHDICVNLSDPALNGIYKPYTTDSVEWETQTLRAAGSVADMLYNDHADVRVGVVDLGTLTWTMNTSPSFFSAVIPTKANPVTSMPNGECAALQPVTFNDMYKNFATIADDSFAISNGSNSRVYVKKTSVADAAALATALSGVPLYYELATPTTTPISPALPMTYKVQAGGSESIIVPDGEVSAAPVLTVAEGESAAELVMDALAAIAAPDGPVATANHAINTYLTMGGKLYKVTSAIAVGETIVAGTNVTETTVMAELIARTA